MENTSIGEQDSFLFVGVVASFFKVDINLTDRTLTLPLLFPPPQKTTTKNLIQYMKKGKERAVWVKKMAENLSEREVERERGG